MENLDNIKHFKMFFLDFLFGLYRDSNTGLFESQTGLLTIIPPVDI